MKAWKKSSRSISTERLQLQEDRDKATGLRFERRTFIPVNRQKPKPVLWFICDALLIAMVLFGLFMMSINGFTLQPHPILYVVLLSMTLCATVIFHYRWNNSVAIGIRFAILIVTAAIVFAVQEQFISGFHIFYYQLRITLQMTYNESEAVSQIVQNPIDLLVFLSICGWIAALWLSFAVFEKENFVYAMLLVVPMLALILFCGGGGHVISMFLLLFGVLGLFSLTRNVRHRRLWGEGDSDLYNKNLVRFEKLQRKNLLIAMALAVILTIPGFYIVRPFLNVQLLSAERVANRVEGAFLSKVLEVLPDITADRWNLEVYAVGGGVSDGALQDVDGYQVEGVEDLKITLSGKPEETIYLKGYIGSRYTGTSWEGGFETDFDASALTWKSQGDPRLYIQNLPFLRTEYVQSKIPEKLDHLAEPQMMKVERLNANEKYTYLPYAAFLNDYYAVADGDGYIEAQAKLEDSYYFYYREDVETILSLWSAMEHKDNILEHAEKSYGIYCSNKYLEVDSCVGEIAEIVENVMENDQLNPEFDIEQIVAWVRSFLATNYEFDLTPEPVDENVDFLQDFLFSNKKGNSVHYASAGVELFRLFGIPARYVIGYVAPAAIFTIQPDGVYTATLQDDNAQAWTEIYISGIGWLPVDVTPGTIGTLAEVGVGGERIQTYSMEEESILKTAREDETADSEPLPARAINKLTEQINRLLNTQFTVEQVVQILRFLVCVIVFLAFSVIICRLVCQNYGFDPFNKRTRLERLLGVYAAFYRRLQRKGLPDTIDTYSEAFDIFMKKALKKNGNEDLIAPFFVLREKVYAACYGDGKIDEEDIQFLRKMMHVFFFFRHPRNKTE